MHLVAWQNGVPQDIGGGAFSSASVVDMNEAGHVLGSVTIPPNSNRTVLWDGSSATDLGTLPGGNWTSGAALNDSGGVVVSAQNSAGKFRAARWDGTSLVDLGTLPGGNESFATGINEQGQIVGLSYIDATHLHGFLIDDGVMYDINDLLPADSVEVENAQAISDSGHILAFGRNGQLIVLVPGTRPAADYDVIDATAGLGTTHDAFGYDMNSTRQVAGVVNFSAFRFDGTAAALVFGASNESSAVAINESGSVVGYGAVGGDNRAYRYDGTVQFLGTLGGESSFARDINDVGDVVGSADAAGGQRHAFVYRGGVMTDLHALGGTSSEALGINQSGTVIGYSSFPGSARGFVYDGSSPTDIGSLGSGFTVPRQINDSGVIVGSSAGHAFRYENGSMASVAPPGSSSSDAIAISEGGAIAGAYLDNVR